MKSKYDVFLIVSIMIVTSFFSLPHFSVKADSQSYDQMILADTPVAYWPLSPSETSDQTSNGLDGTFTGSPSQTLLPNGDAAVVFNGIDQYFTIPDNDDLEVTQTGILTVEAWMRPDVLQFPNSERAGYVHWMGKGETNQHSWAARMYDETNDENRPNRISGYSFNLSGGLGAGSYFQDPLIAGEWIHYTLVINTVNTSSDYTTGYTKLYKNGVLRDQDRLSDYNIVPGNSTAPMRIGTRDFASFFQGAIGKVALYDYELTPKQISDHYQKMVPPPSLNDKIKSENNER
ncbi:LamG domain-containing protein [Bacillaceae bacterium SIJ1]|uniref:LamG domain-containing protein n=1 Tax=Litoribacterium kuwaitense TaxID=1398745 RepID=UPI0013ECA695|nr:LamG domain-containing protein [Litoribacterium kuwaitense]NGP44191.1 LamG domain-containing protein [Litoribacterium kuwaitense]